MGFPSRNAILGFKSYYFIVTTILQIESINCLDRQNRLTYINHNHLNYLKTSTVQTVQEQLKPHLKHYKNQIAIMYGFRVRSRCDCSPCCDYDDYLSIRLTTGTGTWRRNRVLRSFEEEEYFLGRSPWRYPAPRRRFRFDHYY